MNADIAEAALDRLEWQDGRRSTPDRSPRFHVARRAALAGGGGALVTALLAACGSKADSSSSGSSGGIFGSSQKLKFVFVNHVTTNPFFVPTRYGAQDACDLLGCSYQWTGSENSNVNEMVNATNTAITGGADGIAIALVDDRAFNAPTDTALKADIPVVGYNADASGNGRLAYIGQDLYASGQEMGNRIVDLVGSGPVAIFIATPGSSNLQPRIDGALSVLKAHSSITTSTVATGAAVPAELSTIDSYVTGHSDVKGLFAVDAGSTQSVAQTMQKHSLRSKGVKAGGYDLTPITQNLLAQDQLDFTIDQQPYLQGFLPVLELYLYSVSKTLSGMADVNTGLKFLDKTTVVPYNGTKSRFEGTSKSVGVSSS
ncbi:MAG TPA: sugar ABC transporter substrate-binding protein [Nocardioides sp.]|uniref:sugar ABC transporter substrate-binding protein n=1 Tax=Nocardioides sp. TaxID=35761 RepID=UPI002E367903|nr:sugar ABC transporter substrate-binding protein [Nocardioides sp.]HEX3930801.1 sugar ABC transporter substrate-binding protein [Nocardioides sp.]